MKTIRYVLRVNLLNLRHNYWFIPLLMMAGAMLLASIMLELDRRVNTETLEALGLFYEGDIDGERLLLATIAGSMITVAGTIFSIVMVALSFTSTQSGPRLLINFMRDRGTQIVLGVFTATFIYSLLVLRTIRVADSENGNLPHLSVTIGILMAILSFGVLIYFVHHTAEAIQIPNLIARVGSELQEAVDTHFPNLIGLQPNLSSPTIAQTIATLPYPSSELVISPHSGYLRLIDTHILRKIATTHDLVIWVRHHPGDFVAAGGTLARIWSYQATSAAIKADLKTAFVMDTHRSPDYDIEFLFNELVEVGLRAISPAINDPFTAMSCLDWLGAALCQIAERELPLPYYHDENGKLRLISYSPTFKSLMDDAFNQLRQYGQSSVAVTIRLLETLQSIAERVHRMEDAEVVKRHASMTLHGSTLTPLEATDREDIELAYQSVIDTLEQRKALISTIEA